LNKATKVDAILNAWLDYVALEEYSSVRIDANSDNDKLKQDGVKLVGDHVLIEQSIFLDLQKKVSKRQSGQQDVAWVLSFPQVFDVDNRKSFIYPLFSLDVTSILKGEYQQQGWNLNGLKLAEAGSNLTNFLGLDDEQCGQLITQDGLRRFLETSFGVEFQTYEDCMQKLVIPRRSRPIKRQPYLFEFTGGGFSWNLKVDLKDINSHPKSWIEVGHPAYEYLFGEPQSFTHKTTYMGAFLTDAPTSSQLQVLKHAQSEPLTAVQGPPGSGKTTLILHVIAQQLVNRAIRLIETGEDTNNLTIISSTNNKAVENVIEKLDKCLANEIFYLKGGNKENIKSDGGAIKQIQKALDYLQQNSFDENQYTAIKQQIQNIKDELKFAEDNYLKLQRHRFFDEDLMPCLQAKVYGLGQSIEEKRPQQIQFQNREAELREYEQIPLAAYQQLQTIFGNAKTRLPKENISWFKRILLWFNGGTEGQILKKVRESCESAIISTAGTPFWMQVPTNRSELVQKEMLVRQALENANELTRVQDRFREISASITIAEQQRSEARSELSIVENSLASPLEDFYASFHENFHIQHKELFHLSRAFLTQQALRHKDSVERSLRDYSSFLSESGTPKHKIAEKMAEKLDAHIKAISLMFPVITATLPSIRNMLPWVKQCVDRAIVDEAGMITLHQTFPLLVRSRKAIIVGDPLQIEPVISLSDQSRNKYRQTAFIDKGLSKNDCYRFSPEEQCSATSYHRAAGASGEDSDRGKGICLKEHYRCQPSIIQYCDNIVGYGLEVKTEPKSSRLGANLIAYHVEGNIRSNINEDEVTAVCELFQLLLNKGYTLRDIGVISPFNVHAGALKERLCKQFSGLDEKSIGTVHKFQGSEKKVIILSTKVCSSQDNVSWINKRPNLLNVAVSRAKELFILVGNLYMLEKAGSYTGQLVKHIRKWGEISEYKSDAEIPKPQIGAALVYDCDHLQFFRDALEQAEQELIIVTPWIRDKEARKFVNDIVSTLEKNVKVTLIYTQKGGNENDSNDPQSENKLKALFSEYPNSKLVCLGKDIHRESRGTNEKILVCDSKFAIVGSWNWLSHPYRNQCERSGIQPNIQIRRETSIHLSDSSSIEDVKARIYQLTT